VLGLIPSNNHVKKLENVSPKVMLLCIIVSHASERQRISHLREVLATRSRQLVTKPLVASRLPPVPASQALQAPLTKGDVLGLSLVGVTTCDTVVSLDSSPRDRVTVNC
jgi:hypothetical protein